MSFVVGRYSKHWWTRLRFQSLVSYFVAHRSQLLRRVYFLEMPAVDGGQRVFRSAPETRYGEEYQVKRTGPECEASL